MNEEIQDLINLLYNNNITQYGKRKLIDIIEKQQKEIEELKTRNKMYMITCNRGYGKTYNILTGYISKDKIKEKIEKIKEDENFYKDRDRMYEFNSKINILKELLGDKYE